MPVVDGAWVIPERAFLRAGFLPPPIKLKGGHDGWDAKAITKSINTPIHQLTTARGIAMDIEQHAVEVSGEAEKALASLKSALDKFKSTLANDLTSIKAASTRVQNEAVQMKQAYQAAEAMLTTPEFERAVANAERMAAALESISRLSETKISVAVFNGGAL